MVNGFVCMSCGKTSTLNNKDLHSIFYDTGYCSDVCYFSSNDYTEKLAAMQTLINGLDDGQKELMRVMFRDFYSSTVELDDASMLNDVLDNDIDRFNDWVDGYSDTISWDKFRNYIKCSICGDYDTDGCICYAR